MSGSCELGSSDDEVSDAYVYVLGRYLVIRQETIDLAESGVDYNVLKHNPPIRPGRHPGRPPPS